MSIGQALKEARALYGVTQKDFASELYVSRSTVAMVETGERELPDEAVPVAVGKLDCGFLAMEVAAEYTGGAFVSKLDGDGVDLHRSSVKAKTAEELTEALSAIQGVCVANRPEKISSHDREQLEHSLLQVIDAIVALAHYVAVICREYRFSWTTLWRQHRKKLKANGYLK
ncbi:helix-turn-helix transcriptional regulator [Brevibacillus sp. H7]|uniref:helix-turn-helix transcriptional regulator n=1 Tax=Brevibacillus sp. H7 TaxID=3349138 RepID=UPI003823D567